MKRGHIVVIAAIAASSVIGLPSIGAQPAHALAAADSMIGPVDNAVLGASNDGHYVLTTSGVIDTATNTVINAAATNGAISGNGSMVVFATPEQLDPVHDTDSMDDIYAEPIAGGTAKLMTPGGAPNNDYQDPRVNDNGTIVTANSQPGAGHFEAFRADGVTTVRIDADLTTDSGFSLGLSGDGRYALIGVSATTGGCGCTSLFRKDLQTNVSIQLALNASNQPMSFDDAVLSGDGHCAAIRELPTSRVWRDCTMTAHGMQLVSPPTSLTSGRYPPHISMSDDGSVLTWLQDAATTTKSGTSMLPQAFELTGGNPAIEVSGPDVDSPDGQASGALVTGNGSVALFTSTASNLVATGQNSTSKVIAVGLAPPPQIETGHVPTEDTTTDGSATMSQVDVAGRHVLDVSADGRYVLTGGQTLIEPSVVDRVAHTIVPLGISPSFDMKLSGDGRTVYFASQNPLTADDTDSSYDVYSIASTGGTPKLFTVGQPGWDFSEIDGADLAGTRIVVRGENGGIGQSAAFVASGTSTVKIGASLGVSENAGPSGISDDGHVALMWTDNQCAGKYGCPYRSLFRVDLATDAATLVGLTPQGTRLDFTNVVLSGDGNCLALRDLVTTDIFHQCLDWSTPGMLVESGPTEIGFGSSALSMTRDGSTISWGQSSPTRFKGETFQLPQMFERRGAAPAQLVRSPDDVGTHGALPSHWTVAGLISEDGSTTVFTIDPGSGDFVTYARGDPLAVDASVGGAFTARTPIRIVDTRIALGYAGPMPVHGTTIHVPLRGVAGIANDATAVALQVTAAEGTSVGFVSVTPSPVTPTTSNLNISTPGETIANLAIVPIGPDGSVTVYAGASTHVIIDLTGWWTSVLPGAFAGRYKSVGPSRILDTRPESAVNSDGTKPATGSSTIVQVAGRGGVPATGVGAVVVNITLANTTAPGFVQATAAGALVIAASSTLNVSSAGQVIAATAIVPVDAAGRIVIYTQSAADLIVDVNGWFTDASSAYGTDGMFVANTSVSRVVDTRIDLGHTGQPGIATRFDIPATGGAIVGNITLVDTAGPGFAQLGPAATMVNGSTSSVNASGPQLTIANAFIVTNDHGIGAYTSNATHLVIDTSGYMTTS